jgi:hypothetical protein
MDLDLTFWIKFGVCFGLFVIIPVWLFRLVDISFMYKILFTICGAVGVFIGVNSKTLGRKR